MKRFSRQFWFWIFIVFCSAAWAKEPLKSPWDLHPVALTDASYECPSVPTLPHDFATNSYYTDGKYSIPDPVLKKKYEDSVATIEDFSRAVVRAADDYQTTGSHAAALCAVNLLDAAAKQQALTGTMGSGQASYVQKWNLGAWSVAYLKVRNSELNAYMKNRAAAQISEEQEHEITSWLKQLAEASQNYIEEKRRRHQHPNDSDNNHLYWAGFAVAAAGIANDDRKLFDWGVDAYKRGVHDIQPDGTLPNEMARGQMALHYHLYSLAPLMMLAEFGEVNGIDLYAERDYAIKRLVARCVAGLQDPSFFQQKTGVAQVTDSGVQSWQISWAVYYTRRFPDPKISELIGKAEGLSYTMLGGSPPK
jgi:poly(beta-D-mannuronate) lyase